MDHTRTRLWRPAMAVLFLVCATLGHAASPDGSPISRETRFYKLPSRTALELNVPTSWKQDVQSGRGTVALTVNLTSETGGDFEFLVSGLHGSWPSKLATDPEALQQFVESQMQQLIPTAEEGSVRLFRIDADHGFGFVFTAADQNPKEDEFKYLHQGALAVSDTLILSFTILSNDEDSPEAQEALQILKTAKHGPRPKKRRSN